MKNTVKGFLAIPQVELVANSKSIMVSTDYLLRPLRHGEIESMSRMG